MEEDDVVHDGDVGRVYRGDGVHAIDGVCSVDGVCDVAAVDGAVCGVVCDVTCGVVGSDCCGVCGVVVVVETLVLACLLFPPLHLLHASVARDEWGWTDGGASLVVLVRVGGEDGGLAVTALLRVQRKTRLLLHTRLHHPMDRDF